MLLIKLTNKLLIAGLDCKNSSRAPLGSCLCGKPPKQFCTEKDCGLCSAEYYCYDDGNKGKCIEECEDFPILTHEKCGCYNNTCDDPEYCSLEVGKCTLFTTCEDLTIVDTDHCSCIEALTACKEAEYCDMENEKCSPDM